MADLATERARYAVAWGHATAAFEDIMAPARERIDRVIAKAREAGAKEIPRNDLDKYLAATLKASAAFQVIERPAREAVDAALTPPGEGPRFKCLVHRDWAGSDQYECPTPGCKWTVDNHAKH